MKNRKRWHVYLITAVLALTAYNILPTITFYSKPLKAPVDSAMAADTMEEALMRASALKQQSIDWLASFANLLHVKAPAITTNSDVPGVITLSFAKKSDADLFCHYLPRAGATIQHPPAQLALGKQEGTTVTVYQNIALGVENTEGLYTFGTKRDEHGDVTPLYKDIVSDRLLQLGIAVGGASENAELLEAALRGEGTPQSHEFLYLLSQNIVSYAKIFGEQSPITKRFYATLSQGASPATIQHLVPALEQMKDRLSLARITAEKEGQETHILEGREKQVSQAIALLKNRRSSFQAGKKPWNDASLKSLIRETLEPQATAHVLSLDGKNPLISAISVDWITDQVSLLLHDDILTLKESLSGPKREQLDRLIYNEVARISRVSGEELIPYRDEFQIALSTLPGSSSFSVLSLSELAKQEAAHLATLLGSEWEPLHQDLQRDVFPILDYDTYLTLPANEQRLGLVIYAPGQYKKAAVRGCKENGIYVIAKGVNQIVEKLKSRPDSPQAKQFMADFEALSSLLRKHGFHGFSGKSYPFSEEYARDFIYESEDFFTTFLHATREKFGVYGTKRHALLEYTNVEQRILTKNTIETKLHEELLKWRDEHRAAQVHPEDAIKYSVPAPTKNVFLSNLRLSVEKYFRGDDRKVLRWGLDLSGGKTVQIELRDQNGRIVTNEADLNQGINELYNRVNKMGVSEVTIRREGSNISLDFPSAQGLSATDLVKASSMYFHIVNEKFSPRNGELADAVRQFLHSVWNEAVVTNQKDIESINHIAWKHLYGDATEAGSAAPASDAAKILYASGLRLAHPGKTITTNDFDDTLSKIAIFRGDAPSEWEGQPYPLMIVFNNYALEGSSLHNVHGSYDPSQGNFLVFEVKSSETGTFRKWTTPFAKSSVQGTPLEKYGRGGWRMAVILNGSVISAPNLLEPLTNKASITGQFSQREVNLLEADLKAGSLTYAPHILSEKNVSPELGLHDRVMGILATVLALVLVIAVMIGYYRFAGVIASVAVLVNLAIMWAALQNIQATITLAGIAAAILTLGMAVDANVLVFERIREERKGGMPLRAAISAGYKKAFSAIFDSNFTTIIAALILLNFDSGPIKGFAVTLIIGIASSMFTALFMTRTFFIQWAERKKTATFNMALLIKEKTFDFLKYGKVVIVASIALSLIGGLLLTKNKSSIFGMDFTGGYSLTLDLETTPEGHYRAAVTGALEKAGLSAQEFQVRELSPANSLRILLSHSLDNEGKPFHAMPLETQDADDVYAYMKNPRIQWIVSALENDGLTITSSSLAQLDTHWTSVSGQMSDTMRKNALIGLSLALLCILAYITIRFEFKYAVSATLGLAFDLSVAIGLLAILNALGVPIQIDLNTIAALMTIIGYSLNDTIIIFDRIREDIRLHKGTKSDFSALINSALSSTLSRTIMTSATTLVVLIALVSLGGQAIFGLATVMIIGVVYGTLSSLTVAAPLLLFFHRREKRASKPSKKVVEWK